MSGMYQKRRMGPDWWRQRARRAPDVLQVEGEVAGLAGIGHVVPAVLIADRLQAQFRARREGQIEGHGLRAVDRSPGDVEDPDPGVVPGVVLRVRRREVGPVSARQSYNFV